MSRTGHQPSTCHPHACIPPYTGNSPPRTPPCARRRILIPHTHAAARYSLHTRHRALIAARTSLRATPPTQHPPHTSPHAHPHTHAVARYSPHARHRAHGDAPSCPRARRRTQLPPHTPPRAHRSTHVAAHNSLHTPARAHLLACPSPHGYGTNLGQTLGRGHRRVLHRRSTAHFDHACIRRAAERTLDITEQGRVVPKNKRRERRKKAEKRNKLSAKLTLDPLPC
ncbi:hypothetical protein K438DRAFT_903712 [Mycena galopus ATCC 62051]|nr:hypothetical protein K438DRAFT_903712 [Mycena galopus ATCC 62051]